VAIGIAPLGLLDEIRNVLYRNAVQKRGAHSRENTDTDAVGWRAEYVSNRAGGDGGRVPSLKPFLKKENQGKNTKNQTPTLTQEGKDEEETP